MSASVRASVGLVGAIGAGVAMAVAGTLAQAGRGGGQTQVIHQAPNPYAPSPYRLVPNWPLPNPTIKWGQVISADPDAQDNIWVLQRGDPPLLKFDQAGKLLAAYG